MRPRFERDDAIHRDEAVAIIDRRMRSPLTQKLLALPLDYGTEVEILYKPIYSFRVEAGRRTIVGVYEPNMSSVEELVFLFGRGNETIGLLQLRSVSTRSQWKEACFGRRKLAGELAEGMESIRSEPELSRFLEVDGVSLLEFSPLGCYAFHLQTPGESSEEALIVPYFPESCVHGFDNCCVHTEKEFFEKMETVWPRSSSSRLEPNGESNGPDD